MLKPLVSIVILNWNGRKYLERFLPSVLASGYPNLRVAVADNASTDDSVAFLRSAFPETELILHDRNYGFAGGYNRALQQVKSDYYILLNSDVETTPGWIEPVIELMESDKRIAACQPKLLQYDNRSYFEYSGASGGWLDKFGYPFARGRVFDVCERDEGQYDETAPVFWASGAAMFVKADIFHALGGLDDYFFAHQEEIDFCWRLQSAGYSVYCCPRSVIYHVGGGTLPKGNSNKVFLNFRNNLIMLAKNLPLGQACWKIPFRLFLDAISAFKSLAEGEGKYFIAVFRAHFGFWRWLLFGEKKHSAFKRPPAELKGYLHKSVVWAYFISGKKRFDEIVGPKQ
ncbi:MAG: glycosyltransferase family 2 protein [Chitinophagaceae bacterium]|nr:glycosyltransferase family 2 protein [Chitinophagaceae bacterium]